MQTLSVGVFTDKSHRPTEAEILKAIGACLSTWRELIRFIREKYRVQEEFKFLYGAKYGWGLRSSTKGKLLTSLYPVQRGFTVQIILRPEAVEKAQRMKMGRNVRQAIARAKPWPKERWLFIPVESNKDLQDIQHLLALRAGAKQR
jgi:hypothetical protein